MGINLLVLLLLIGIVGLPRFRMRYDRLFSWMMFFASSIIVYNYCIDVFSGINEGFQYLWSKTKLGNLYISFLPQTYSNYINSGGEVYLYKEPPYSTVVIGTHPTYQKIRDNLDDAQNKIRLIEFLITAPVFIINILFRLFANSIYKNHIALNY